MIPNETRVALAQKILDLVTRSIIADQPMPVTLDQIEALLEVDLAEKATPVQIKQFLTSYGVARLELSHLRSMLRDTQMAAEAWKIIAHLTPDAARAQLLTERDQALTSLANLRAYWNEREPQLYAAERKIEALEDELKRLQSKAA
jgi:hypothetical protein